MKISVITVCFNSAATIADTLASVRAQTHRDVEHIIIDGGSTDSTLEIVHEDRRAATKLFSGPDMGIYDAMNKGLRFATGDYVGFLNADDLLASPAAVASLALTAERHRPRLLYGDLVYVARDNPVRVIRRWRSGPFRSADLRRGWMPPHPTFYADRGLIEAVGGFDASLRIAADYDFMVRCLMHKGVTAAYVPEVLVRMRLGGASNASVSKLIEKSREDLRVIRRHRLGGWPTLAAKNLRKLPQFW